MAIRALNPSSAGQVTDKPTGVARKITAPQMLNKYAALQEKLAAKELVKAGQGQNFVSRLAGQIPNAIPKRPTLRSLAKVSHPTAQSNADEKGVIKRGEALGLIRKLAPLPKKPAQLEEKYYHFIRKSEKESPVEKKTLIENPADYEAHAKILTNWIRMQQSDPGFGGIINRYLNLQKQGKDGVMVFVSSDFHISRFIKKYITLNQDELDGRQQTFNG